MMPRLTLSGYEPMLLHASSLRKYKGSRLPGSEYWFAEGNGVVAHLQEYEHADFGVSYRLINAANDIPEITITEKDGSVRMEALLEGTMIIGSEKDPLIINAGQYRITRDDQTSFRFLPGSRNIKYITARLNKMSTEQNAGFLFNHPFSLSASMHKLLMEILKNRYQAGLLPFYYENCVRELFFLHASQHDAAESLQLSPKELIAVHEADRIIRENLHHHFSIHELARKTGTNEYKLKKDFRMVFNVGLFGRLLQLRMEYAGHLLQTTQMPVKDIAERAGYDTVAGFITAFRKYYGSPPGEWRSANAG